MHRRDVDLDVDRRVSALRLGHGLGHWNRHRHRAGRIGARRRGRRGCRRRGDSHETSVMLRLRGRRERGQRNGDREQYARADQCGARAEWLTLHAGLQDGEDATFECGALREGQRERGCALRGDRLHHGEQLRGVRRRRGAGAEHQVVAGALGLDALPARDAPDQRMKPVQRADHLAQQVGARVAAAHVRELVQQHDAALLIGPRAGIGRQDDDGAAQAEGHRNRGPRTLEQAHRLVYAELGRGVIEIDPEGVVGHRRGAAEQAQERDAREQQAPGDQRDADQPPVTEKRGRGRQRPGRVRSAWGVGRGRDGRRTCRGQVRDRSRDRSIGHRRRTFRASHAPRPTSHVRHYA